MRGGDVRFSAATGPLHQPPPTRHPSRYNFALSDDGGKRQRQTRLHPDECDAVADILVLIACDAAPKAGVALPFMTNRHCRASNLQNTSAVEGATTPPLTFSPTLFHEKIKPLVIDALIKRGVVTADGRTSRSTELMEYLSPEQIATIRRYLQSERGVTKESIEAIRFPTARNANDLLESDKRDLENNDKSLQQLKDEYAAHNARFLNFLAVQKEVFWGGRVRWKRRRRSLTYAPQRTQTLRQLFVLVTEQRIGKHYAQGPVEATCKRPLLEPCFCGGCLAIPADNGRPSNSSLFGSTLERLLYTSLLFIQEGVPKTVVEAGVRKLGECGRWRAPPEAKRRRHHHLPSLTRARIRQCNGRSRGNGR